MNEDQAVESEAEGDWYDTHLAAIGRSADEDYRICVHEAGHALAARLLGNPLGGTTCDPDPNARYGGLVWGPRRSEAYAKDGVADQVPDLCDKIAAMMPKDGEPRNDAADVFLHAFDRGIEIAAAGVAERMLLEGDPVPSASDDEHLVKYASLVTRSPEAALQFIKLCEVMAADLLHPYVYV
jgi:hypothetical protein